MNYTIEKYDNRADWLRARKRGIGGSDAPCVLGMGRWRGAYSIATDKLTEAIDESTGDEMQEWGRRLEPAIAQKFAEVMAARGEQITVVDPGEFTIFRSKAKPHLFCTPDRLVYRSDTLIAELSLKCAWYESAKEWATNCPLGYQIQNQHTMNVLGIRQSYFAALLNGCSFKWHSLALNERWIAKMIPRLDAFWAAIQRGEYPNVDESAATAEALARRYPNPSAGRIDLPAELAELGAEYDEILKTESELDKKKTKIQNMVKAVIADNSVGVLPDQSGFGWKMNGKGSRRFSRIEKVNVDG